MKILFYLCCVSPLCMPSHAFAETSANNDLQLTLPPAIYAVPGIEISIYFDNIILSQSTENLHFKVTCGLGHSEDRRWTVTPNQDDVGAHPLVVSVYGEDERLLSKHSTILHVVSELAGAKADQKIRLLIIGDSLTHASAYPNEVGQLLSQPGNPNWEMLGTHKPASAVAGIAHEGYGGWTWERFVTKYEPDPDGTYRKRSSPFVFLNDKQTPALDFPRYLNDNFQGERPNCVVIMLGINDCFGAPADDPVGMDARINSMFEHADKLVDAIRQAEPKAQIGICLTTPPNSRQAAFQANYKDRYTRWGWKRIQHRLVQRQLEYIAAKKDPQISAVPTQLNLDPVDGYPVNNGVHPNGVGYKQIGTTIYCWLKWRLSNPVNSSNPEAN